MMARPAVFDAEPSGFDPRVNRLEIRLFFWPITLSISAGASVSALFPLTLGGTGRSVSPAVPASIGFALNSFSGTSYSIYTKGHRKWNTLEGFSRRWFQYHSTRKVDHGWPA